MKKKLPVIALIVGLATITAFNSYAEEKTTFVAGKYSKRCYVEGKEHGNIKVKFKFNTIESCLMFIR